jgi:predicted transcriptional regulator
MRIRNIMETKYAAFQTDDRLDRILETFSQKRISSAPVFAKDEFVGIVSYANLAKFFTNGKSLSLAFAGGKKDDMKMNAAAFVKKPSFVLAPDAEVGKALGRIVSTHDCIPVMDQKRLVGVVRPEHVIDFYLEELANAEAGEQGRLSSKAKRGEDENSTSIDRMLEIVTRDGTTTPKKAARELGITESTAEDLAKLLDKHKLVEINYSFLTGMTLRRIEHG